MDSPAIVLENSSGFLSVPPRLEYFFPALLLLHHILNPETLQLSYFSIFMAFLAKMGPTELAKNMFGGFSSGIHHNIQKARKLVHVRACQEIIVFSN